MSFIRIVKQEKRISNLRSQFPLTASSTWMLILNRCKRGHWLLEITTWVHECNHFPRVHCGQKYSHWYNCKSQNPMTSASVATSFFIHFSYKLSSSKYKPFGSCVIWFQEKIWSINSSRGSVEHWLDAGSVFTACWPLIGMQLMFEEPSLSALLSPLGLKEKVASNTSWSMFQKSTVITFYTYTANRSFLCSTF